MFRASGMIRAFTLAELRGARHLTRRRRSVRTAAVVRRAAHRRPTTPLDNSAPGHQHNFPLIASMATPADRACSVAGRRRPTYSLLRDKGGGRVPDKFRKRF